MQARSGTSSADFRTAATKKAVLPAVYGSAVGSYCRRPDSVSGWMVAAVCQRLLLTNRKWQLYHTWDDPGCRLQGARTVLPGKTPSNTAGNAGDEPQVNMDDAGKLSAPSILGAGCTLRQASGYGGYSARGVSLDGQPEGKSGWTESGSDGSCRYSAFASSMVKWRMMGSSFTIL